eukprot:gene2568-biopygen12207
MSSNKDPKSYTRRDNSRHAHVADGDCSTSQSTTDTEDEHNFMALAMIDGSQPLQYADSPRGKSTSLSLPHASLDDNAFFGPMSDEDACLIELDDSTSCDAMPVLISSDDDSDDDDDDDDDADENVGLADSDTHDDTNCRTLRLPSSRAITTTFITCHGERDRDKGWDKDRDKKRDKDWGKDWNTNRDKDRDKNKDKGEADGTATHTLQWYGNSSTAMRPSEAAALTPAEAGKATSSSFLPPKQHYKAL